MKTIGWALLIILFLAVVLVASAQPAETTAKPSGTTPRAMQGYGKIPLHFEANTGQADPRVKFLSRGSGYTLFLEDTDAVLALRKPDAGTGTKSGSLLDTPTTVLRMRLVGANPAPQVSPLDPLPATSNYFIGSDPKSWRTNVPLFAKVRYEKVYPGIDLVYYGNQRQLEYDFVVAPGANPQSIRLRFEGATKVKAEPDGSLVLTAGFGDVTLRAPFVYQEINGSRRQVAGRFVLRGKYEAGFEVSAYDASKALVIDPTLVYSTWFGRYSDDAVLDAAVDAAGNVYVLGTTDIMGWVPVDATGRSFGILGDAPPWPLVNPIVNPTQPSVFLFKLSPDGQSLVYSTFISGSDLRWWPKVVAADPAGNAYVAGFALAAGSVEFPLVNPVETNCHIGQGGACDDYFVFKLSPTGDRLIYSTYLGTNASFQAFQWEGFPYEAFKSMPSIAADPNGNFYLAFATTSANLPVVNGFQDNLNGESDVFLVKLDAQGGWAYSTYLGGSGREAGFFKSQLGTFQSYQAGFHADGARIAIDAQGNVFVAGTTDSQDFPVLNAAQPSIEGTSDVFLTKLTPSGSLAFSTYLGGMDTEAPSMIAVDPTGNSYLGVSSWSPDFPVTAGRPANDCAWQGSPPYERFSCRGSILVKLNGSGSVVFATALGIGNLAAVDSGGNIYTNGVANPLVNPLQASKLSFVGFTKLDPLATTVLFSTPWVDTSWSAIRHIRLDAADNIYLVGTICMRFPEDATGGLPILNAIQPENGAMFGLTWSLLSHLSPDCLADQSGVMVPYPQDIFISKISQTDNTPAGAQVAVKPVDGASITFESVASSGTTMFSQNQGYYNAPPSELRMGDPPTYVDISTTASYTGGVTICLSYSKTHFDVEFDLKLYHFENGAWTDITTSLDTANDIVCGVATSLSPFAIFGAPLPPMEVAGLAPPLAPLVLQGNNVSLPDKAFKLGKTLPLKFQLLVSGVLMTAQEVKAPTIVQLSRVGEPPLNLDTLDLDAGQANDSGYAFRSSDSQWVYNLSTKGLSVGTYSLTIQMPDGRRYVAGFALTK